jgi:hypothetical protein
VSYFISNFNHVSCISQHKQVHMNICIYHICNILFDLTIMLEFFVITDIITFDVSHDGHI